jgi:hypothetical protein
MQVSAGRGRSLVATPVRRSVCPSGAPPSQSTPRCQPGARLAGRYCLEHGGHRPGGAQRLCFSSALLVYGSTMVYQDRLGGDVTNTQKPEACFHTHRWGGRGGIDFVQEAWAREHRASYQQVLRGTWLSNALGGCATATAAAAAWL